ncbi:hypothetical protein [Streptomyces niveus]|uniref:hypothetical protein n=1 Tax=Streptomyces niveus TaxID=193462 RepID=UPI0034476EB0
MTEWRDCTAFFFPLQSEGEKEWLHKVTRNYGFLTAEIEAGRAGSGESHHWVGLPVRLQAISTEECRVLAISYYNADFEAHITNSPAAWERFCISFTTACIELDPLVAVTFGFPSDDIRYDIKRYDPAISAEDGAWLRAQTYELMYLCRELDVDAQNDSPSTDLPGFVLTNGGRVTAGPFGRSLPLP